jgi:hypothetical protein
MIKTRKHRTGGRGNFYLSGSSKTWTRILPPLSLLSLQRRCVNVYLDIFFILLLSLLDIIFLFLRERIFQRWGSRVDARSGVVERHVAGGRWLERAARCLFCAGDEGSGLVGSVIHQHVVPYNNAGLGVSVQVNIFCFSFFQWHCKLQYRISPISWKHVGCQHRNQLKKNSAKVLLIY